jgi:hypothetical protein
MFLPLITSLSSPYAQEIKMTNINRCHSMTNFLNQHSMSIVFHVVKGNGMLLFFLLLVFNEI